MKENEKLPQTYIKVPEEVLLSLVALKLKDRVLFPEKVEQAKKDLANAIVKIS